MTEPKKLFYALFLIAGIMIGHAFAITYYTPQMCAEWAKQTIKPIEGLGAVQLQRVVDDIARRKANN